MNFFQFHRSLRGYDFYNTQGTYIPRWVLYFNKYNISDLLENITIFKKVRRSIKR